VGTGRKPTQIDASVGERSEHAATSVTDAPHAEITEGRAMIEQTIAKWHRHLRGELPGGLDELLHDDVVFYSPIVFTPQEGKAVTKLYLEAAGQTLPGTQPGGGDAGGAPARAGGGGAFHYTKQVMSGDVAVLEFETTVEGKYVNGVDIIRCDDAGRIVEFRVMIRPLQAINLVHRQMAAMLETMKAAD
jgi:hypothetical protein